MARRDQNLYLDPDDKMIGGVCSGLGHYFDVDTTLVRAVLVMLTLVGGGGLLGYLILWAVLDPAPAGYWTAPPIEAADSAVAPAVGDGDVIDVTGAGTSNPVARELHVD